MGQTKGEAWGESMLSGHTLSAGGKLDSAGGCVWRAGPEESQPTHSPPFSNEGGWLGRDPTRRLQTCSLELQLSLELSGYLL